MALVKRLVKGSALTFAEGDGNLTYLDNKVTGSVNSFPVFDTVNTVTTSNITKFGSMITIDGGLTVTGDLTAMQYIISSSVTHFTESFSSGSTVFGDSLDDTHKFTGSLSVTGSVTANTFVGNGSGLTNLPATVSPFIATGSATASVSIDDTKIFSIYYGGINCGIINANLGNASYGNATLKVNTTGIQNTAFGEGTLYSNTTGNFNTSVGYYSLKQNTIGAYNTSIGNASLNVNVIGEGNTSIGYASLTSNVSGSNNVSIGTSAGQNNISGSGNVFIGYTAGLNETNSDKLYISNTSTSTPLIKGNFSTGLLQFNTAAGTKITGSLTVTGSSVFSGSATGVVNSLGITSNTASLDLTRGNFFTLQLVGGSNTYINPTNIQSGQTVSILLSTVGSGTVSFPANVFQASDSPYTPTTTTGKDIITLVSFDNSNLYLTNVKNLV